MIHSKRSHEGYLLIDHSASPGLPADFYRAQGIDAPAVGEGRTGEFPTLTCTHCGTVVIVNPSRVRERPYCGKCDHYVCDACAAAMTAPGYAHVPFKQIVDVTREGAFRAENGYAPLIIGA